MSDHVTLVPPSTFRCLHCGQSYAAAMPAPIDVFAAMSKSFERSHRECARPEGGPACGLCGRFGHTDKACPTTAYGGSAEMWLNGPDTGLSSKTIYAVLAGKPLHHPYEPLDPADFGRCHRLLHAIPGWRERIGEMATVPGWELLAPAWDELEALYLEELPTGTGKKLYRRMRQLADQRRARAAGATP